MEAVKMISSITKNKNITSLSDINLDLLYDLKGKIPIKLLRRARHVITENNRVLLSKKYLLNNDIEKLGVMLFESHQSLKCDYSVSTEKLDFLIDEIAKVEGVYGARLMGAGFGGSIISIIEKKKTSYISEFLSEKYYEKFRIKPGFFVCQSSDGTKRIF